MSKRTIVRLAGSVQRLWSIIIVVCGLILFIIAIIVFWECLTRVPSDRATTELQRAGLDFSRRVALEQDLTRRIASVEIHDADQVTFCGESTSSRLATIDVVAPANGKDAAATPARQLDAPPQVPELSLGSEKPWTLELKLEQKNQIVLLAKSAEPVLIEFYARPSAKLGERLCDKDIPVQARGSAVRLVVHLRPGDQNDSPKWPEAKLLGELWPQAFTGELRTGTTMTLILSRFRSCTFNTGNREYNHFELTSTGTSSTFERARKDPPGRGEIVLRSISLGAGGLVTALEWDPRATWGASGDCSCRCTEEAKAPLEVTQ